MLYTRVSSGVPRDHHHIPTLHLLFSSLLHILHKMASQNQELLQAIAKAADQYPKPPVTFSYGTAGFRTL
jgi:uncharacterized membrane protein YjjP (DUF1212 family)